MSTIVSTCASALQAGHGVRDSLRKLRDVDAPLGSFVENNVVEVARRYLDHDKYSSLVSDVLKKIKDLQRTSALKTAINVNNSTKISEFLKSGKKRSHGLEDFSQNKKNRSDSENTCDSDDTTCAATVRNHSKDPKTNVSAVGRCDHTENVPEDQMFRPRKDRAKVFSGRKRQNTQIAPQYELGTKGGKSEKNVQYEKLKSTLTKFSPMQLSGAVANNPEWEEVAEELFRGYVERDFPYYRAQKSSDHHWCEIYNKLTELESEKLNHIKQKLSQKANVDVRKTQLIEGNVLRNAKGGTKIAVKRVSDGSADGHASPRDRPVAPLMKKVVSVMNKRR